MVTELYLGITGHLWSTGTLQCSRKGVVEAEYSLCVTAAGDLTFRQANQVVADAVVGAVRIGGAAPVGRHDQMQHSARAHHG